MAWLDPAGWDLTHASSYRVDRAVPGYIPWTHEPYHLPAARAMWSQSDGDQALQWGGSNSYPGRRDFLSSPACPAFLSLLPPVSFPPPKPPPTNPLTLPRTARLCFRDSATIHISSPGP